MTRLINILTSILILLVIVLSAEMSYAAHAGHKTNLNYLVVPNTPPIRALVTACIKNGQCNQHNLSTARYSCDNADLIVKINIITYPNQQSRPQFQALISVSGNIPMTHSAILGLTKGNPAWDDC